MDTERVPKPARGDRKGKRPGRRARGVSLKERDGYWHAHGTVRVDGRSIRVRRSLGLAVASITQQQAETQLEDYIDELKARATGKAGRGDPVAIAGEAYLSRTRKRPLGPASVVIIQEMVARFGQRRLNEIGTGWNDWIDGNHTGSGFTPGRMTGRKASSRERFLGTVLAVLAFAKRHHGLAALPVFERDKAARNPNRRARRRVAELRPDLIRALFDAAHITIRAQLAVEHSCGARVSSVLYAARVCDLILAKGREQITFPATKNGEDVTAALDSTAVAVLKDYLRWRGKLHEREEPLFLTYKRKPYIDNGRAYGGQNKTGFKAARRRAQAAVHAAAEAKAAKLARAGNRKGAAAARHQAAADAELLGKVTQHWFRHMLATRWVRKDLRAAMDQAGWLDARSALGYTHDLPERRRELVAELDELGGHPMRKARQR
jgi:site-specific recombinase XerD